MAMDLREVVDHFADACPEGVVFVGTSMGCAVIWSYLQLFGDEERLRGVVLVDQAPLQNRRPDWNLGSKGCFDAASYAKLAEAVRADMDAFADGNAEACLVSMEETEKREPGVLHALKSETLKCDPEALCELMYDHTHQDWRSACANTAVPALVLGGRKSKIFPWEGVARRRAHEKRSSQVLRELRPLVVRRGTRRIRRRRREFLQRGASRGFMTRVPRP